MSWQQQSEERYTLSRVGGFLRKSWREQARSIFFRWIRLFPKVPVPVRLPFGGWWLAQNDFLGAALFYNGFENVESVFVERFLHVGMTVLDIGAHHGYYTLLASRKVGPQGLVLAVEASPRERKTSCASPNQSLQKRRGRKPRVGRNGRHRGLILGSWN